MKKPEGPARRSEPSLFVAPPLFLCMVVAVLGLATAATAQVSQGDRVRVEFAPDQKLEGNWVRSGADSLTVSAQGKIVQIEWASIYGVQRYDGEHRNWKKGVLIGAVAGATFTALAIAMFDESEDSWDGTGAVFAEFMVLGGASGALIGSLIKSDKWETIPLEDISISAHVYRNENIALVLSASF